MRARLTDGDVESPLLLYVGRLGIEKRLERLVSILRRDERYRLALVGEGPAENFLRNEFKNHRVKFMGPLRGKERIKECRNFLSPNPLVGIDLSKAFASADVFVMPSNTETLGFVVMEALASG